MSLVRTHIYISGKVQGVFFRACTRDKARELGLKGWVKNLMDGRVEAIFEGEDKAVEDMLDWCRKGSPHSIVIRIEVNEEPYTGKFRSFEVRYR